MMHKHPTKPSRRPQRATGLPSTPDSGSTRLAGGLDTFKACRRLSEPPRRAFRTNRGETVYEDLLLVGWVEAPRSARAALDFYGIDVSFAHHDPRTGRWEGCFFSEPVADMLAELSAENEFPYPFEAIPSWAALDWWVRKSQGETERPAYEIYLYCAPGSPEAIRAWQEKSGVNPVRRATPANLAPKRGAKAVAGARVRTRERE